MGRGPWPTVLTLAGIAAVICLVGWPRPTLAALGGVAGAGALIFGVRRLLTERRPAPATECPERETEPNPCGCPCTGCKHNCAAHTPDDQADAPRKPWPISGSSGYTPGQLLGADLDDLTTQNPPHHHPDTTRTITIPTANTHPNGHTVGGGTFWHSGPPHGCTLPGCRPSDRSGPDPDTARTDPDTTRQHGADQPGHDPDGLGPAHPGTPLCTATWPTDQFGTFTCWQAAAHNDDDPLPPLHAGESDRGWRFCWLDTDLHAKPHQADERAEGSNR